MFRNFSLVTLSGGTKFHARCAICGDSKKNSFKKRFHLDWQGGNPRYHCFNCDAKGGFLRLYTIINRCTYEEAKKELLHWDEDRIKIQLDRNPVQPKPAKIINNHFNSHLKDFAGHNFPVDSLLYKQWLNIIDKFVSDRKVPKEYQILYSWKGYFQGRLIVPIFDEDVNLTYFQARRIPETEIQPKYKNPVAEKSNIILNEHKFQRDKFIIVTEGLLDAFMIGNQGTTCLGKEIPYGFLKRLRKLTDAGVILAYDNDTEGVKSMKKFMESELNKMVKYFIMPSQYDSKDINILSCDHNIENMYQFIVKYSYELFVADMRLKL
jgi:5S rRNA maturation endonuclease (ribonuclease M5)